MDYDIAVPNDAKLWLRNNFGNVEIRNVHGWADVENGHGKLELRDGGAAKLTNSFGQVDVNGADGNLTVVNNNGAVTVSTVKGTLDVKDRFAAITVSKVQGAVIVSGGNGAVEISDAGSFHGEQFLWQRERPQHPWRFDREQHQWRHRRGYGERLRNVERKFRDDYICQRDRAREMHLVQRKSEGRAGRRRRLREDDVRRGALEQVGGSIEVEDSNGEINVKEVKGHAKLNTSFGAIEATGVRKGVRAITGNGTDIAERYWRRYLRKEQFRRCHRSTCQRNTHGGEFQRPGNGKLRERRHLGKN